MCLTIHPKFVECFACVVVVVGVPPVVSGPPPNWADLPLEHATKHVFDHVTGSWSHQRIRIKLAKHPFARGTLRLAYYMKEYPTLPKQRASDVLPNKTRSSKSRESRKKRSRSRHSTASTRSTRSDASADPSSPSPNAYSPKLFSFARKLTLKSIRKSTVSSGTSFSRDASPDRSKHVEPRPQRKQSLRSGSKHQNLSRGLALTENELNPGVRSRFFFFFLSCYVFVIFQDNVSTE